MAYEHDGQQAEALYGKAKAQIRKWSKHPESIFARQQIKEWQKVLEGVRWVELGSAGTAKGGE
jgi:hypothetical protein